MLSRRLVTALALLLFATACGDYSSPPPSPTPTPDPGGRSASIVIPVGAEFLGDVAFAPPDLVVRTGTTVTWMNSDRDSHTTTSDAPGWNSGTMSPGRQFSFTFPATGTFPYHCTFHPGMVGKVVVTDGASERTAATANVGR